MNRSFEQLRRWGLGLLLTALVTACGHDGDGERSLPSDPIRAQIDPSAINIGSVGWRTSTRDTVLLAAQQINAAGGVLGRRLNAVAVVARDNAEAQRLGLAMLDAGVVAMNVSTSTRTLNLLPTAMQRGVPLISESSSSPTLTTVADNDLLYRIGVSDVDAVPVLAQVAFDAGKRRAVVVVNENDAFGAGLNALFSPAFEALGGSVVRTVAIPFGLRSGFAPYLQQVFDAQPDVVLNAILNAEIAANVINEALPFGYTGLYLLPGTAAGNQTFIDNLANPEAIVGGARGSAATIGAYGNPSYQAFRDRYRAQYGIEPQDFTAPTYDIVMILALAIEHAGRVNGTTQPTGLMIRDSLRAVMNAPGVKVRPENIAEALALVRSGVDVDYAGAYADIDWDSVGDIAGVVPFTIFQLDAAQRAWDASQQLLISLPRP